MARFIIDNRAEKIDFAASEHTARTIQNCKNLLRVNMGEIPYDRLRGIDPALYEKPLPQLNEQLAQELDRALLWEPDAELVDATAEMDENGEIVITAVIEVRE